MNVTTVNATATSYLTVYPAGATRPGTSNLTFTKGQTTTTMVVVAVGTGGKVSFSNRRRNR